MNTYSIRIQLTEGRAVPQPIDSVVVSEYTQLEHAEAAIHYAHAILDNDTFARLHFIREVLESGEVDQGVAELYDLLETIRTQAEEVEAQ